MAQGKALTLDQKRKIKIAYGLGVPPKEIAKSVRVGISAVRKLIKESYEDLGLEPGAEYIDTMIDVFQSMADKNPVEWCRRSHGKQEFASVDSMKLDVKGDMKHSISLNVRRLDDQKLGDIMGQPDQPE